MSLERATRQAAAHRLFQHRVTPALRGLCFRGLLEAAEALTEDELGFLRCTAAITDQLGGGRGRGLGLVRVSLAALPSSPAPGAAAAPTTVIGPATFILLGLEAEEALHLPGVKDQTNYAPSRDYVDGAALRGAVAAALSGVADEDEMDGLLGGGQPAVFGDARPGPPAAVPAPLTLREPKRGGPPVDEAVLLCAESCGGRGGRRPQDMSATKSTFAPGAGGWSPVRVVRRTVTRTARDAASGAGSRGKLFSHEVLDPFLGDRERGGGERLRFHAPVYGSPEQLALVLAAAGRGLVVGGERSYGYGRLRLVAAARESPLAPCEERHRAWARMVGALGVGSPEATGALLAVGPLAVTQERLLAALRAVGLDLREGVARRQSHGGWNSRLGLPRTLASHFVSGSTFIVARPDQRSALAALAELEATGIGPGRADGWGRLVACHPIHVDCHQEV